jgi:hypothetical protein
MTSMNAVVSVYCDWTATEDCVRAATRRLALPAGVDQVTVGTRSDTLGCRVAVDLVGIFDENAEGRRIARRYAGQLSESLGLPAFALHDLMSECRSEW